MQYVVPILLAVFAVVAYFVGQRHGATNASKIDGSKPLIDDLRLQLGRAQSELQVVSSEKSQALERAATGEAEGRAAIEQLAAQAARQVADLERVRGDATAAEAKLEQRYNNDLAELKKSFAQMSTEVLKGMTPDVTKEVATKVEPLIAQVNTALETYRKAMQQSLQGQDQALTQVREQMAKITETTTALATSTNDFTAVLKSAQHRGKWGEQTLRRVVEAANLSPHCDFREQMSQDDSRPDLIVKLPGNRCIIIDSKVPDFDVAIADQASPSRRELVTAHAAKLRKTIRDLV